MSQRVDPWFGPQLRVDLDVVCPQLRRYVSAGIPPANAAWNGKSIRIGSGSSSIAFTNPADPCLPNTTVDYTVGNNFAALLLTAGNWGSVKAVGAMFGSADSSGPFTAAVGSFYTDVASLSRVNGYVDVASGQRPMVEFVGPYWPVWLCRSAGSESYVATGGTFIDVPAFQLLQLESYWGEDYAMIVHPDHQLAVARWQVVPSTGPYPVSMNWPSTVASTAPAGTRVLNAYVGFDGASTVTADGIVIRMSTLVAGPTKGMRVKGLALRS